MDLPLIAIVGEIEGEATPAVRLPVRYGEALQRAGGLPLVVSPVADPAYAAALFARVDGLLFAGGDDFDTDALGLGPTHPAAKPVPAAKQAFDVALARAALAGGVPTLGICYGMQLLALAEGGDLLQHLPDDRPDGAPHAGGVRHDVRIEPRSKLAELVGLDPLGVISRHHQALRHVGPLWSVEARDEEGLVEAIERREHPFALGVQWHPELEPPGTRHDGLFRGLVRAALALREARGSVRYGTVSVAPRTPKARPTIVPARSDRSTSS